MRMLPSANPSRYQHREPSVVTTCTRARCRSVRKPGPRPNVHAVVSGVQLDTMIGQPSGHRLSGRIRPDTVHSTRHAMANQKRRGQGTDERQRGIRTSSIATTTRAARRDTPSPLLWGRRLRLGNQGWLGHGNTASATVTTAATRQLLGVAPPSKPRLGALLSSDDYGSSVERAAKRHPLWQGARRDRHKLEQARSGFDQGVVSEPRAVYSGVRCAGVGWRRRGE
jgi:hypothetical protein